MANTLMLSQMGLSLVGAWGQYQSASISAGLQTKIQEYRNTMTALKSAQASNAITSNEIRTRDDAILLDTDIQKQAIEDQGAAAVAAGAAGVDGNSVEMVARNLKASAATASYRVQREEKQRQAGFRSQRTTLAINAAMNKDVTVIPKPSIGSMLLGATTNLLDIYQSHQPPE